MYVHIYSPNSCLPTWGPSGESLNAVVVRQLFPAPTSSFFSHVLANIHIFELSISECCSGSRKSTKSLVGHFFSPVHNFKMSLWPPRGSIFRCMQHYAHHCYHQNRSTTTRISIKIGLASVWSCAPICIFLQTRK